MATKKKKKSAGQSTRKHTAKKISSRNKKAPARTTPPPPRKRTSRAPKVSVHTLDALNERLDIMLPEVMFRIAAIEHIMVKNQLCSYDELVNARQYIQEQERS